MPLEGKQQPIRATKSGCGSGTPRFERASHRGLRPAMGTVIEAAPEPCCELHQKIDRSYSKDGAAAGFDLLRFSASILQKCFTWKLFCKVPSANKRSRLVGLRGSHWAPINLLIGRQYRLRTGRSANGIGSAFKQLFDRTCDSIGGSHSVDRL